MQEAYDWRYFGKIAASIALSVVVGLFWISNAKKATKITKNPGDYNLGSLFEEHLSERTLVALWASWCSTCKEDLVALNKLQASNLPEGFSILAVNIDEKKNLPQAQFIWSQLKIEDIKLIFDLDGRIQNTLSIDILPTYFLFEKNGKTLLRLDGQIDFTDKKVRALLFN